MKIVLTHKDKFRTIDYLNYSNLRASMLYARNPLRGIFTCNVPICHLTKLVRLYIQAKCNHIHQIYQFRIKRVVAYCTFSQSYLSIYQFRRKSVQQEVVQKNRRKRRIAELWYKLYLRNLQKSAFQGNYLQFLIKYQRSNYHFLTRYITYYTGPEINSLQILQVCNILNELRQCIGNGRHQ